jgi:hypothetical protein
MLGSLRAIVGHVGLDGDRPALHGLLVKATARFGAHWNESGDCTYPIGCDLTDATGHFWIPVPTIEVAEACQCKGYVEIVIQIFDRAGHLVHNTHQRIDGDACEEIVSILIVVPANDLMTHLSRPLSWQCTGEPLLPDSVYDDIEEALEIRHTDGEHSQLRPPRIDLSCATPLLAVFHHVLRDACNTLDGDLLAARRFRDAMDAICAGRAEGCGNEAKGPHAEALEHIFAEPCQVDPCQPAKLEHRAPCCTSSPPACLDRARIVSNDTALTLVMAALHVSCGHEPTARTYLGAILDQLCQFQLLGALHRAALDTIYAKPGAFAHLDHLLQVLACRCPPDGSHAGCDAVPCCEICVDSALFDCIRDAYLNWCAIRCYRVTRITPQRACPGERVVICGCGFGDRPGAVRFVEKGSMNLGPLTAAESWSDTRIVVVVPDHAGCGLALVLPVDTINVCDRFLDYRRIGSFAEEFEGTNAQILSFLIKGHYGGECLLPGEILRIRWKTCAADHVAIRIVDRDTGVTIAELSPAPAHGRWDFTNTDFQQTTRVEVVIEVQGQCKPARSTHSIQLTFQRPPNLSIDGVEVTQAIQYYRAAAHLTDPNDRGPDNSLRLVSDKAAWVRCYLRSGQIPSFDMGQLPGVSGTLTVERRVRGIWFTAATLNPVNGPVTAQDAFASYDAERADIDASLNFIVPSNIMRGLLRFTIQASSPHDCRQRVATAVDQFDLSLSQTLQIAAVSIGYNGPPLGGGANVSFAGPTAAQIATEAGFSLQVYPVRSQPNIRIVAPQGPSDATQPLNNTNFPAGGCDPNWTPITTLVANARTNDGNQAGWFYYGFVTPSIPISHGNVGCATNGNGAGLLGGGTTLAHEIGHQAGLDHAPCGAVGTVTPGFPRYEPYDMGVTTTNASGATVWSDASIGEYGLDVSTGTIYNPDPVRPSPGKDLMGYCNNRWVSIFLHDYMVNNPAMNPVAISTGATATTAGEGATSTGARDVRPFITLVGEVTRSGDVVVNSVARLPTRELMMTGSRTQYVAELLDDGGEVAASAPVFTMPMHDAAGGCGCGTPAPSEPMHGAAGGCGCGKPAPSEPVPPFAFIAALPDVMEGSAIRIRKGDDVVWERTRPSTTLRVTDVCAEARGGQLHVSWNVQLLGKPKKAEPQPPEVWLRWSADGTSWNGLAVGLRGTSATIDASTIPVAKVKVQVVAHDGFRSVKAESPMVELPRVDPVLAILQPRDGQRVRARRPLHLWGTAVGRGEPVAPQWLVDGEEVAEGLDAWTSIATPGEHRVTLRAPGATDVDVAIVVIDDRECDPKVIT